ncbi:MAG: GntR family transcriptional regulator [Rhodanobacteraceae bacterium]|nr:GntR family transcriptional regulator [Rhodanobacteraceae bacterium]
MARTTPLLIDIVTGDARPIARQIADAVRLRISTGELAPGDQLPSVRGLAQQLGINPNTVAKAYGDLTTEGWLEARAGLGLYVAPLRQRLSADERERRLDEAVQRLVCDVLPLNASAQEIHNRVDAEFAQLQRRRA